MKRLTKILAALVAAWKDAPSCCCDSNQGRGVCTCVRGSTNGQG